MFYDFLSSKNINDVEFFEEYMVRKTIEKSGITYIFEKNSLVMTVDIHESQTQSFRVTDNVQDSEKVRSKIAIDNNMVIERIRYLIINL